MAWVGTAVAVAGTAYGAYAGNQSRRKQSQAFDDAKKANETRYAQILSLLKSQGYADKADIARSGKQERGQIQQNMTDRGLAGTTVGDTLNNMSYDRESRATTRVDEDTTRALADAMEARTDAYPAPQPFNAYAEFAQVLGSQAGRLFSPGGPLAPGGGAGQPATGGNAMPGFGGTPLPWQQRAAGGAYDPTTAVGELGNKGATAGLTRYAAPTLASMDTGAYSAQKSPQPPDSGNPYALSTTLRQRRRPRPTGYYAGIPTMGGT